jgi:membrane-associated HD superfamily phosphohydrolase
MERARQHHLPPVILQFIQQHHGTTLVEYFYKEALRLMEPNAPQVSETQYRYPGPKPKSRETAILMMSDCCESACRAMDHPDAARVEKLVNEMALRRLHDGQFDECDLTMRDLVLVRRTIIKTLMGIHHGRVAYPSDEARPAAADPNLPGQRKLA